MIGKIEFLKCAGSLATGEYPVLDSDGDYSAYVVNTVQNCKYTEDLQQRIVLPTFDDWSSCNIVHLENVGFYWITDAGKSSIADNATEFALEFNAPMTMLSLGMTIAGMWIHSPVNFTPWKQIMPVSGVVTTQRRQQLPRIERSGYTGAFGWVSITTTQSLAFTDSNNLTVDAEDGFNLYGFPVILSEANLYSTGAGTVLSALDYDGNAVVFPSIGILMASLTSMGFTKENVVDISVTTECPYAYSWQGTAQMYFILTGTYPRKFGGYGLYHVAGNLQSTTASPISAPSLTEDSMTLTLTESEYQSGAVGISDYNGSIFLTIPIEWFDSDTRSLTITTSCHADYGQMYRHIKIGENVYSMAEPHIPYLADQWSSYRAYSQSFDRESMEKSIDYAHEQLNVQTESAIANTIVNTVAGIATSAINPAMAVGMVANGINTATGIVTSYRQQDISDKQARFQQDLTERRIQAQPASAYNVSYGIGQIINVIEYPIAFNVMMPNSYTDALKEAYIENFGYSNEGEYDMPIQIGFYQGTVYSSPTMTGIRFDALVNAFNNGIHIIGLDGRTA